MSDRTVVGLCRGIAVVGATLGASSTVAVLASGDWSLLLTEGGAFFLFSTFFAAVVWVVAPRQPRNRVTWLLSATAFFTGVYLAAWIAADLLAGDLDLLHSLYVPAETPTSSALIIFLVVPWATGAVVSQLTLGLLLFPTGKLPSPGWRWAGVLATAAIAAMVLSQFWVLRPGSTTSPEEGPTTDAIASLLIVVAAIVSVVALAGRFRRSTGTARQQIKWILWGGSMVILSLAVLIPLQGTEYGDAALAVFALAGAVFVASYGIALGKYRLYDIDVVISRTVVYGALALFITAFYVAAVVGIGSLLGNEAGSSPWLSIGATAVVAFAFEPLRERLQRLANRLVYGKRATPYEVLSDFSRNISATDDELLEQVARSLAEGTSAREAAVWVRRDGAVYRTAVWPSGEEAAPVSTANDVESIPDVDLITPVVHDGEALGALTLTAARGQTLLPTDERLLGQMASGMGLALRNIRLGEDLRDQVGALSQSRQRLVTVQDETRRHLERQLHDGVQQRLVALKVRLTLARREAEASGVDEVADLLDHVGADTDQAIDSLRDFARGIYPPLLEAEGAAAALSSS